MARYRCPACGRRIEGDRRCHRCGWLGTEDSAAPVAPHPWRRWLVAAALALMIGAVGAYRLGGPAIADWYAAFAMRHLPAGFSSIAPADTPSGAFNHCVSRVVKKVSDDSSVETFPAYSPDNTVSLGPGRYSVRAVVEGTTLEGETVLRAFACVVRFDRGRWVTERLAVGDGPETSLAALAL